MVQVQARIPAQVVAGGVDSPVARRVFLVLGLDEIFIHVGSTHLGRQGENRSFVKLAADVGADEPAQVQVGELVVLGGALYAAVDGAVEKVIVFALGVPLLHGGFAVGLVVFAVVAQGVAIPLAAPDALQAVVQLIGIGIAALGGGSDTGHPLPAVALAQLPGLRVDQQHLFQGVGFRGAGLGGDDQLLVLDNQGLFRQHGFVRQLDDHRAAGFGRGYLVQADFQGAGKIGFYSDHAVSRTGDGTDDRRAALEDDLVLVNNCLLGTGRRRQAQRYRQAGGLQVFT